MRAANAFERFERRRPVPGYGIVQPLGVLGGAIDEDGVDHREADRPAEIAGQVEQPRCSLLMRCGASVPSPRLLIGTMQNIRPKPRKICGMSNSPERPVGGYVAPLPSADGEMRRRSRSSSSPWSILLDRMPARGGHEHWDQTRDEQRLADHHQIVAADAP